ncbi:hypothetical protein CBS101457_003095 [Exobasidium rhododendri]|nr:hypothetical protein CBS101457_003095 [Exobasidium rhododendri]
MANSTEGMLKSRALVLEEVGKPFSLQDVYIDEKELDADQVIVEFKATGICHTDLSVAAGVLPHALPCVLGHEGGGVIKSLPKGYQGEYSVGDTVLCSYNACGNDCTSCKTGSPAACHKFFTRIFFGLKDDGSTTDAYTTVDRSSKVNLGFFGQSSFMQYGVMTKVDSDIPLHLVCAFGCGIMSGFGTVLNKLLPAKEKSFSHLPDYATLNLASPESVTDSTEKTIVIFGIGAVGVGAIVGAKLAKIKNIIAVDVIDSKSILAKEAGATHFLNAKMSTEELTKQVKEISADGAGANMSLEASGALIAITNAIACLAPQGKCASIGAPALGQTVAVDINSFVANTTTYMGVLLGDSVNHIFLPYMLALFKRGDFDIMKKLVTKYKPEDVGQALQDMKEGKVIKPVIVW